MTINTNTIFKEKLEPILGKWVFLDDGISEYWIDRSIEFEKNGFIYTEEMDIVQKMVDKMIFEDFNSSNY